MRRHPRLREYLLERLRGAGPRRSVRCAGRTASCCSPRGTTRTPPRSCCARRMPARARRAARSTRSSRVIDRLDYAVAEGWLHALEPIAGTSGRSPPRSSCSRSASRTTAAAASPTGCTGGRARPPRPVLAASGRMMAWSYWHLGRCAMRGGRSAAAGDSPRSRPSASLCTSSTTSWPAGRPIHPTPRGRPLDALVMRVHYAHGRLPDVGAAPASLGRGGQHAVAHRRSAGDGHPEQALELYAATGRRPGPHVWTHGIVGAELMIDLGADEAPRGARPGPGDHPRDGLARLRDAQRAHRGEARVCASPTTRSPRSRSSTARDRQAAAEYRFIGEQPDTWRGLALLRAARTRAPSRTSSARSRR